MEYLGGKCQRMGDIMSGVRLNTTGKRRSLFTSYNNNVNALNWHVNKNLLGFVTCNNSSLMVMTSCQKHNLEIDWYCIHMGARLPVMSYMQRYLDLSDHWASRIIQSVVVIPSPARLAVVYPDTSADLLVIVSTFTRRFLLVWTLINSNSKRGSVRVSWGVWKEGRNWVR